MEPLVNPRDMSAFGRRNLILTGAGSKATPVVTFAGPLSLKSVLEGRIDWRTPERLFRLAPDSFVILNEGQEYALSTDYDGPCRTFCVFFEHGYVESAVRSLVAADEALLEAPDEAIAFGFFETVSSATSPAGQALVRLARAATRAPAPGLDWLFHGLAEQLAREAVATRARPARLASLRASTRREIHRRLLRARAAVEDQLGRAWTLRLMAREAAMAPHHFARCFAQCFGETPHAFLTRRRLERAGSLLRSGRFTVTQACLEIGYASLPSFSRAYHQRFGRPPSADLRNCETPAGRPLH